MPECTEDNCEITKIAGRGRCTRHYQQWRQANAPECSEDGCAKPAQSRGLCPMHYQRRRHDGELTAPERPEGTWAPIPGFESLYEASDTGGRVWSLPRATTKGQVIRHRLDPAGYHMVTLSRDGEPVSIRVHLLVLLAYRGPCPPGKEGAHDNGIKNNNDLSNLFWKTRSENMLDKVRHGTHTQASRTHCPYGHEYNDSNTRWYKNGRYCKNCDRTRSCQNLACDRLNHDHVRTPWPPGSALLGLSAASEEEDQ